MRKALALIAVLVFISGCCTDGNFCKNSIHSAACAGPVDGYTLTAVAYGDSKLLVVPLSDIRNDTEWRFILKPLKRRTDPAGSDYDNATVTISGKGASDAWINTAGPGNSPISGTLASDGMLTACVKNLPDTTIGSEYSYIVHVDTVGTLDPRGRVEK